MNKLLLFVLGLYIIVKFMLPQINDINALNQQISLLHSGIQKNREIINNKQKIDVLKKQFTKIEQKNLKYVFKSKNNSSAFTSLQQIIKNSAQQAGIKINTLKWLSPVKSSFYDEIPIKINFKAEPEKFYLFIKKICHQNKIIISKFLKVSAINSKNNLINYEIVFKTYNVKD